MTGARIRSDSRSRHLELSGVIGLDVGHTTSVTGKLVKQGRYQMGLANIMAGYLRGRDLERVKLERWQI
jgi:hypothetical protein